MGCGDLVRKLDVLVGGAGLLWIEVFVVVGKNLTFGEF